MAANPCLSQRKLLDAVLGVMDNSDEASHDLYPDRPLTPEEAKAVSLLPVEIVESIDTLLLSEATEKYQKVAKLVGFIMSDASLRNLCLPDVYYASRVKALVAQGILAARGDLDCMR